MKSLYVNRFKHIVFFSFLFFLIGISGYCQAALKVTVTDTIVGASQCVPASVFFRSFVTGASHGKITYSWTFSNGSTSTDADPITVFTICGSNTATVIVKDSSGQVATATITFSIVCNPVPDFSVDTTTGCPPLTVTYKNLTPDITGYTYRWDFCDGTSSLAKNPPAHSFNYNSQCYCTTLSVTNAQGCQSNITKNNLICVTKPPVASFTTINPPSSCAVPYTVNFSSTSTGTGLTYFWKFNAVGSGMTPTTSTAQNPSVKYTILGNYTVILTVTDSKGCTNTTTFSNYVNLNGNNFDFTQSASNVCLGTAVSFTGVPALTNTWTSSPTTVTPTSPQSTQDVTFNFTKPGNYNICYTVTFTGGCGANKCSTVVVNPIPTVGFSVKNNGPVCAPPLNVTLTNTSSPDNYLWSCPGGTPTGSLTSANPGPINYATCGDYSISLHVSNAAGCFVDSTINNAVKINCPKAGFIYLSPTGRSCVPRDTVHFYADTSADKTFKYFWDFDMDANPNNYVEAPPNGKGGDVDSISHIYTVSGCYKVGLKIVNSKGCGDTTTRSGICLGIKPTACFTATPLKPCIKEPVVFTNCSTAGGQNAEDTILNYTWFYGDGGMSFLKIATPHPYKDTGHFTVKLAVCNHGCCDTMKKIKLLWVQPPLALINVVPVDCNNPFCRTLKGAMSLVGSPPTFPAPNYVWKNPSAASVTSSSIPDTTETICFPKGNLNYSVTLLVTEGRCRDSISTTIPIRDLQPNYSTSITVGCAPLNDVFTNLSTGNSYSYWRIYLEPNLTDPVFFTSKSGTASLNHTFATPGVYYVDYIGQDDNGCQKDFVGPLITVYGVIPAFSGTPLSGCPPLKVTFSNTTGPSTTSKDSLYRWIFGDGTSTSFSPTRVPPAHTYPVVGSYDVSLIVEDNHGCFDTLTKTGYVNVILPKPDFVADTAVCKGSNTCFTNLSTGNSLTYKWNFGDTTNATIVQSTALNPCHVYNNVGYYSVGLLAIDAGGCRDSITKTNYIHVGTLTPNFTADTLSTNCPPLLVNFKDSSTGTDNCSTFNWTLAPGLNSSVENPNHLYTLPADYTVQLIVTNCFGCVDTATKVNYIHLGGPTAKVKNIGSSIGCAPYTDCFIADSSTALHYIWSFGDTAVSTDSAHICHTYRYTGKYDVFVILSDGNCNYPDYIDTVTVVQDTAFFRMDKHYLCGSGTVKFTDSSRALSSITYHWDFGDPNSRAKDSSNLQNPTHFFSDTGTYVVTETSTAAPDCIGTWTDTVRVTGAPAADFTYNTFGDCVNMVIQFKDSSTSKSPVAGRHWRFGDPSSGVNNTSDSINPTHIFKLQGSYAVTFIDSSISGCVDSITKNITILNEPTADAGPDKIVCSGTATVLQASGGTAYSWTPGGTLNDSTVASPVAKPIVQTTYTVTVTNGQGCAGRDSVVVNVLSAFKAKYSSDTCICKGASVQLSATVNGIYNYHYKWTPVFGLNSVTISNPLAAPDSDTRYRVIVYDSLCYADTGHINVCVFPLPTLDAGPDVTINAGVPVQLNAETNVSAAIFKWLPASNLSCADCPNPIATVNAPTTYVVSVTDFNGCSNQDSVRILVLCNGAYIFIPNAFTPNGDNKNDVFLINGPGIKELKYLRIYDRWGEKIFESNSLSDGWDGMSKGQPMETGVYVYYLDAVCQNGVQFTKKGNITLIR